jgi:hypothetical protein
MIRRLHAPVAGARARYHAGCAALCREGYRVGGTSLGEMKRRGRGAPRREPEGYGKLSAGQAISTGTSSLIQRPCMVQYEIAESLAEASRAIENVDWEKPDAGSLPAVALPGM